MKDLVLCPRCLHYRIDFKGPHASRWIDRDGKHIQVGCDGSEVPSKENGPSAPTPEPSKPNSTL